MKHDANLNMHHHDNLGQLGGKVMKMERKTGCDTTAEARLPRQNLLSSLGFIDRFLALWVLVAMVLGIVIGKFAHVEPVLAGATLQGVSIPIVVGLLVMMWPILTKVQYERIPMMFKTAHLWRQVGLSLVLNWIAGPLIMLGIAWATLPDLPEYRTGVIMVGLARCIAMVMIWNQLAQGNADYCAIIVIINSILQLLLYSPLCVLFVNIISREAGLSLEYGRTATAVAIYLGIPLAVGVSTRLSLLALLGPDRLATFLLYFGPLGLVGLLYTIVLIFAQQASRILGNVGPVFRTFVPMILYFGIMWMSTFALMFWLSRRRGGADKHGYEMAVVQSFTAASNNFELAIAVAIAVYGADSSQALAATVGPLVEVPVLLSLTYLALYLKRRLSWHSCGEKDGETSST